MKQIASMFLMMAIGVVLVRLKVLKPEHGTVISKILLYAVVPCTIINSYQIDFSMSKLAGMGVSHLGAVLVHNIVDVLERVLRRPLRLEPVESASIFYSNAGNLIIPLVMAALGQEWVFYISGYMLVQQLLFWTHGKSLVCGERQWDFKKIITNDNIIDNFVGI